MLHETVDVLSIPERGMVMHTVGTAARRVASWRTRAARLRPDFVIVLLRFLDETNHAMIFGSQG